MVPGLMPEEGLGIKMDFLEAVAQLEKSQHFPRVATLERMKMAVKELDYPERGLNFIHLAGTNGKGSTGALISAGLKRAGFRVGRFISPHLLEIRERISIGSDHISPKNFVAAYQRMQEKTAYLDLSYFEQLTLIALIYFQKMRPDYIIWETGLGGRLDATNIVTPVLTVITAIGLDHTKFLGDDIYSIAREKAAIIKNGAKVIVAPQQDELESIFLEQAKKVNTRITRAKDFLPIEIKGNGLKPGEVSFPKLNYKGAMPLLGYHQGENALTAYLALKTLKVVDCHDANLFAGVNWPGRLQYFPTLNLLVDGAHNEQAMTTFVNFFNQLGLEAQLIFASMQDKDYPTMVTKLDGLFKKVYLPQLANKRAVEPEKLALLFQKTPTVVCANLKEALDLSLNKDLIAVVGSLYMVGECFQILEHILDINDLWY